MSKNKNKKLALRPVNSLANVGNQIAITNKILKSIKGVQLPVSDTLTDPRDGNVYKTVKIGEQVWMAENLRYIPHISPVYEHSGIWVYSYNGHDIEDATSSNFYKEYGCLYNLETAKSVPPKGWHLPTIMEWEILTEFLGGEEVAGDKLKEKVAKHREDPNEESTNEINFNFRLGGFALSGYRFSGMGEVGICWSSTEYDINGAYSLGFHFRNKFVKRLFENNKIFGLSVRCVIDSDETKKNVLIQEKEFEINENRFCLKIYSELMEVTVHMSIDRFVRILRRIGTGQFELERYEYTLFMNKIFYEKRNNIKFFNSMNEYYDFISKYCPETKLDNNNAWFKKVVFMLSSFSYDVDLNSSVEYIKKMAQNFRD